MNVLRLVFGWLFLAALTAAGTFYAVDEVDQRVGLAKYHFHEKFGMLRYASVTPPKPVPGPIPAPPSPTPTPSPSPGPDPGKPPVSIDPIPAPVPSPGPFVPAPGPTPGPGPVIPSPGPVTPPSPAPDPLKRITRVVPDPTPVPVPPPHRDGMASAPPSKPSDFDEVNERLIDVKSRGEAARNSWASIERSLRSMNQPLRPEISAALSSLRRFTQQAEQALHGGDTGAARRYLDQAEKQMDLLKQYRE